jgi:hypothetical protein
MAKFFCELPGMEITEEHDSFEKAFRALHAYTDMVMDQYSDWTKMDYSIGIEENGRRILLPEAMKRAGATGLMDRILTESEPTFPAEHVQSFDSVESDELVLA